MTRAEQEFLEGLARLTRETGVEIGGCGCCQSPFLTPHLSVAHDGFYEMDDGQVRWVAMSPLAWAEVQAYKMEGWRNYTEKCRAETIKEPKRHTVDYDEIDAAEVQATDDLLLGGDA